MGVDAAAVMVDDEVAGHQMDAVFHGLSLRTTKGSKTQSKASFGKAGAVVADLDFELPVDPVRTSIVERGGKSNAAAGRAGWRFRL